MHCTTVIVNYHSAAQTVAAVRSVASQMPHGSAVIVVDNSCDPVEEKRLRTELPAATHLLIAPHNLGFASACNLAFRQSSSEFVLLLNPDAILLPGALPQLVTTLRTNHALAAVAPATWWEEERRWLLPTLLPETPRQWLLAALAARWPTSLAPLLAARWLAWQQRLHAAQSPQPVAYLSGAVLALRRHAVQEAGGLFDERFFMFFEDADLSRRLRAAGYRLALEPRAEAVHRWRNRASKAPLMMQSGARYLAKHYPWAERWLPTLLHAIRTNRLGNPQPPAPVIDSFPAWRDWLGAGRLLAISPTPTGFPALFRPLGAAPVPADAATWAALEPGSYSALVAQHQRHTWLPFQKGPEKP